MKSSEWERVRIAKTRVRRAGHKNFDRMPGKMNDAGPVLAFCKSGPAFF